VFSRLSPCLSEKENAEKVIFEEVLGFFPKFFLPLAMYHRMFRENDPEPEIFNRKGLIFFHQKCFLDFYPHFGKKKNQKKTLSKKVVRSPWIRPKVFECSPSSTFSIVTRFELF